MRERRKVALVQRQLTLARIARRESMLALATALEDEARSASLAERSRGLAAGYRAQPQLSDGETLRGLAQFSGALAGLVSEAEQSREDAERQALWQQEALAAAETRLQRLDERARAAHIDLQAAIERRKSGETPSLARKLLNRSHPNEAEPPRNRNDTFSA